MVGLVRGEGCQGVGLADYSVEACGYVVADTALADCTAWGLKLHHKALEVHFEIGEESLDLVEDDTVGVEQRLDFQSTEEERASQTPEIAARKTEAAVGTVGLAEDKSVGIVQRLDS